MQGMAQSWRNHHSGKQIKFPTFTLLVVECGRAAADAGLRQQAWEVEADLCIKQRWVLL